MSVTDGVDKMQNAVEIEGIDRRRFPRVARRIGVSFVYEGEERQAQSVDLSKTGALLISTVVPEMGTQLLLNLSDRKDPNLTLFVKSEVVRIREEGRRRLFAVEFGDAVSRDARRLGAFLETVLGISAGLIRVVTPPPDADVEKEYAFSFKPIKHEGEERLRALQLSLFRSFEDMETADAILANIGNAPIEVAMATGPGPAAAGGATAPASAPLPDVPASGAATVPRLDAPSPSPPSRPDIPAAAPASAPRVDPRATVVGRKLPLTPGGAGTGTVDGGRADVEVIGLDAIVGAPVGPPGPKPTAADFVPDETGDAAASESVAGPVASDATPAAPARKKGFMAALSGLLGKSGSKGESLLTPEPVPLIVARDTELAIIYRLGNSRYQAKATKLYCAGLKVETADKLPDLYANVAVIIPVAGGRKGAVIELQGDATRLRPNPGEGASGGVFEVRFSMRTDKSHLEMYRALLEKLSGGAPPA